MVRKRLASISVTVLAFVVLVPAIASAQSGIAGMAKDTTGAVLPGVTVEAASPALIEKVRTVVTDGQGQYKIVDLRPGVYTVTFTLPGFSTVKREGIELTTNFTTTVNAELRVGALEETVTVSGQSPVVDVHNVVQQRVVTSDVIDALPSGRTNQTVGALVPGMVISPVNRPSGQDVGGLSGERQTMAIHGSRTGDLSLFLDGLAYNVWNGGTSISGYTINTGEVQEFAYETAAVSTESPTGGVHSNMIPKVGGNVFKGTVFANYSSSGLQADNSTADLVARGLRAANHIDKMWDVNPSFGGPIKQDKLWFFGSYRYWGLQDRAAGIWFNKSPVPYAYVPDLSRQAVDDSWNTAAGLRVTWQATQKNKFALYLFDQHRCQCHWHVAASRSPEAAEVQRVPVMQLGTITWNSPITSRLLLEAGFLGPLKFEQDTTYQSVAAPPANSYQELSTGLVWGANNMYRWQFQSNKTFRAALSYVTGSHAFKVGVDGQRGFRRTVITANNDVALQLLNGAPRSVTVWATPYETVENIDLIFGSFAQDQWTVKRLTFNAGIRFDHLAASVPEQHLPATRFLPARDFAEVPEVPNWNDLSPRLGAAYDLFGTGTTAVKVTLSRYIDGAFITVASNSNPVNTSVNSASRTWTDSNGDFVPQENELGAVSNANFGKLNITSRYDDALRTGFNKRIYNWETTTGIQHELLPGVSLNATYFRRWFGNLTVTDNLLATPADYDPYCITGPADPRLPGGGATQQLCGFYDITPAKFGRVNNLITYAKNYGKQTEVYNGLDITTSGRLPRGALVQGGLNVGRTQTNNCLVIDSPQQLTYCDVKPPFLTQIKFLGTTPLPWNLQASATFQSLPGPEITAGYVATSTQIRPSLGRNLASGANGTATIPLVQPGTMYAERLYQVDARVTKIVNIGRTRLRANLDLYNALNTSPVLVLNTVYGPAWQQPQYILPGRMIKFGAQVEF